MDHTPANEEPSMRRKLLSLTPSSCCGSGSSGAESSAESSASTSPGGQPRSLGKLMRKLGRRKKKSAPTSAALAVLESPQQPSQRLSQQISDSQYSSPRDPPTSSAGSLAEPMTFLPLGAEDQEMISHAEGAGPTVCTGDLDSCGSVGYFKNNFPMCLEKALHPSTISEDALSDLTRRSVDEVRISLSEKLKGRDLRKGDEDTLKKNLRLWEVHLSSQSRDDVTCEVLLTVHGRPDDLSAQNPADCSVFRKSLGLFRRDEVYIPDKELEFALDLNPGKSASQS